MDDDELNEGALTAEEILTFGPVVEAQVWTPTFIAEARAPIAVAAGRPKLGPVFNSEGVGKAVLIRPCVSRGKRIRGLPPIYTPKMLEAAAPVFRGWSMYLDHVPAELASAVASKGRSVKEMGGQVLTPYFGQGFVQEYDEEFGYQPGAVLAEIWATPYLRNLVGENPNLLHTSIAAWPTSGKPGKAPWNSKVKGMMIEGIRRQPQGSVDFVPRGGAGGRLLLEGEQDPDLRAWPEPTWEEEDKRFVVSLAERIYSSGHAMQIDLSKITSPAELKAALAEGAPHLLPALAESDTGGNGGPAPTTPTPAAAAAAPAAGITEADVQRMIAEATANAPSAEDIETKLREDFEETLSERDTQRGLAEGAKALIESAEGIPDSWKSDLVARYSMQPSGPPPVLLIESEDLSDDEGKTLSESQVIEKRVKADLDHARDLIAEATGKPRVTGEGGKKSEPGEKQQVREAQAVPFWRQRFTEMGVSESEEKAIEVFGGKVEG